MGPMLVAHGYNHLFGPGGLEGTSRWFARLGLRPGKLHASLAAATEISSGALMTVGALGPLPEVGVIGLMTTAGRTDHRDKGFFIFKGGWEYVAVVGAASAALAAIGHGTWSVDHLIGNTRRGLLNAALASSLGIASAFALLKASYRPGPEDGSDPD